MKNFQSVDIKSSRLRYSNLTESEIFDLFSLLQDKEITIPLGYYPSNSINEFKSKMHRYINSDNCVGIRLDNNLIGYFHINDYITSDQEFVDLKKIGIAFVIGKQFQNKGYATEAVRTLTQYLLNEYDVCFADCFSDNTQSKRVIEKSGFTFLEKYTMYFDEIKANKECLSYYLKK